MKSLSQYSKYVQAVFLLVLGFKTDHFPAFYSRKSSIVLNYRVENAREVAKIYDAKLTMKAKQTLLVANPVPQTDEIPEDQISSIIKEATEEAMNKGIKGKAITPFLLANIAERSSGTSMKTNIALLLNNAKTAGEIAIEVAAVLGRSCKNQIGFTKA